MAALCKEHSLVVGADGKCVICRRPSGATIVYRDEPETTASKVLNLSLLACLLVGLGVLIRLWVAPQDEAARFVLVGDDEDYSKGPATSQPTVALDDPGNAENQVDGETSSHQGDEVSAEKVGERFDARRLQLERSKLRQARAKVKVTMYATSWCYICDRAGDMLTGREVPLQILDIEADETARRRLMRLNPSGTVPTFQVEGKTIIGFDPWALQDAVDEAANRHLAQR